MSSAQNGSEDGDRGLTPADLQNVRFTRASMMHPGYVDTEVDQVLHRAAEELGRYMAETAELRARVRDLQAQVEGAASAPPPSEQALGILASAQQTADNYVAEAEEFSRQITSEARKDHDEQLRSARETAEPNAFRSQEAAARTTGGAVGGDGPHRSVAELEEEVAYLKAFGSAVRVQLRSYLEALITDVESEWGRADPAALAMAPPRPPTQRSADGAPAEPATTFAHNTVAPVPPADAEEEVPATTSSPG
jgi:DivIVA domain-containing protein